MEGDEACALSGAEKLQLSKPKQSRASQGRGAGATTNNQRKTLQNNWKGQRKIRRDKRGKEEHIECFIYFNKREKKVTKKKIPESFELGREAAKVM